MPESSTSKEGSFERLTRGSLLVPDQPRTRTLSALRRVDSLLSGGEPLCNKSLYRVTREAQHGRKLCFLLSAEALENVISDGSGVIGTTNTHSHPVEIQRAQRAGNVFEPIVSRVTAAKLQPNSSVGQVEVIVDDDELGGRNLMKREHRLDGRSRAVHKA